MTENIRRICFITNYNQYESKRHFTEKFSDALVRQGVKTWIIDVNQRSLSQKALSDIKAFNPDFTASFHSSVPYSGNKFLWDLLDIAGLSILVDPALYNVVITSSPKSIASCVDRNDVDALKSYKFDRTFFLPHAVERELLEAEEEKKEFDVVFIGSLYDYQSLRESWQKALPQAVSAALENAIEIFQKDMVTPLQGALVNAWNQAKLSPQGIDFETLFYYLDSYTRGFDRVQLVKSIESGTVHVFGSVHEGDMTAKREWADYLKGKKNVVVHPPVSFQKSLEILRKSKICLNSSPFFKNGTHERYFTGPACGALLVTGDNQFVRKEFDPENNIIVYPPNDFSSLDRQIKQILSDEELRLKMVRSAKKTIAKNHTWDNRAKTLLDEIPKFLEMVK